MGNLTRNFSRSEFACDCGCGFDTIDFQTLQAMQDCVDFFAIKYNFPGKKVICIVSGGTRCMRHNTTLRELFNSTNGREGANTAMNSQHIYARAVDHKLYVVEINNSKNRVQIDPEEVAEYYERYHPELSIGRYHNRTHMDSRSGGAVKWDTRN